MQKDKDDKTNDNEVIVIDSDEVTVIDKDNNLWYENNILKVQL